jgi:hypothetical protein
MICARPLGPHEKTLGRSQVFSSPSGGLAQSDRSRGPLKSIAGPFPRLTCPHGGPDDAVAATGGLANPPSGGLDAQRQGWGGSLTLNKLVQTLTEHTAPENSFASPNR